MKKSMILFICILFALGSYISAGELTFTDFKDLVIKNVKFDGFTIDKSRTTEMRTIYQVEFKGDEAKMEKLNISLFLKKNDFSTMDKLGKPELYKYKDRPALFADGDKAGMASFKLILKDKKGKLTISHRVFGGKFLGKADMEKIVQKIGLENLEK